MTGPGMKRRLGLIIAVALIYGAYAGVARADDVAATASGTEDPAVAGSTEAIAIGPETPSDSTSAPSEPVSQEPAPSTEPKPTPTEPVSVEPAPTTEPTPAPTEPVSEEPAPATESTPVPPTEPVSESPEMRSEPGVEASPTAIEPASDNSIDSPVVTPGAGPFLTQLSFDSPAAVSGVEVTAVQPEEQGSARTSRSGHDPGPLPDSPQAPPGAGMAGVSAAHAGGAVGGFAVLVALLTLAPFSLSRVLKLRSTPLRPPTLVAELQRPG